MAELARNGVPSYVSLTPPQAMTLAGLNAGAVIAPGDACYVDTDGLVKLATGAALTAPARVSGFAMGGASIGEAVTLIDYGDFAYGSAMTPGTRFFLSATVPGGLADAATTGGVAAIAYAVDARRIRIIPRGIMAGAA